MDEATALQGIRPMGLGDILDGSLRLYRRNFGQFLGIVAIAYLPAVLLQLVAMYWMLSGMLSAQTGSADDPTSMLPYLGGTIALAFGSAAIYLIAVPLAQGALIWAVSRRYLGKSISIGEAYRQVLRRFGHLLVAVILTGLATLGGTLLCIIPGIVVSFMFSFATIEVVLEDRDGVEGMRRSWQLVSYDFWKVVGTLVVLGILVAAAAYALSAPFSLISMIPTQDGNPMAGLNLVSQAISSLVQIVLQPVQIVGTILLYYDLRIRKEGFDIELLAQAMGEPAKPWGQASAAPGSVLGVSGAPLSAPPSGVILPPRIGSVAPDAGPETVPHPPPPEYTQQPDEDLSHEDSQDEVSPDDGT